MTRPKLLLYHAIAIIFSDWQEHKLAHVFLVRLALFFAQVSVFFTSVGIPIGQLFPGGKTRHLFRSLTL